MSGIPVGKPRVVGVRPDGAVIGEFDMPGEDAELAGIIRGDHTHYVSRGSAVGAGEPAVWDVPMRQSAALWRPPDIYPAIKLVERFGAAMSHLALKGAALNAVLANIPPSLRPAGMSRAEFARHRKLYRLRRRVARRALKRAARH